KIEHDLLYRGGGPIFYKKLDYKLDLDNQARDRDRSSVDTSIEGLGMYALKASKALPGDVIVLSSVSGRTPKVVDLAWEAKKFGMKVIVFTSMEYARAVEPVHSSGKKLYEMADIVLDNCAPAAEAMLEVEGIEARYAAASGIASDYILWSMTSVAIEELLAKGIVPGILKSANFPGGNDYNKTVVEPNYTKTGY
ncbi:MAG: sugar isomerase domain-containing protein, partial [Oscillospiraceae bacterium]|nr:sugar isomerase domain-containing protein [Oscillospiraceae bacterium]